jgi:hypothetical protein
MRQRASAVAEQTQNILLLLKPVLSNTMRPELVDEIKEGFLILRPLYRFIQGLE